MSEPRTDITDIENKLWTAADVLRGSMDAGEYKNVILGLIFLKWVSDAFESHRHQLLTESPSSTKSRVPKYDDPKQYWSRGHFWVPEEARWDYIASVADTPQLGQALDEAMASIASSNEALTGSLPTIYSRPELSPDRLCQVVGLISSITFGDLSEDQDILGRVYEYFLLKFDMSYGAAAGEFYTPREVVKLLVEMVQPFSGIVYDPCCGSGGMFLQSTDFAVAHGFTANSISVYGQEFNPTTWKLARMNLALKGIQADLGVQWADTFSNDQHPELKADFVLSNPPYNISSWSRDDDDERWAFGLPPLGNSNFAWIQHIIHHLAPAGTAAVVLANGSLTSSSGGEDQIRQELVNSDLVDAVVALPSQLFYTTSISVCVWILSKGRSGADGQRDRKGEVLFLDARDLGFMATRRNRELSDSEVALVANSYNSWRDTSSEGYQDIPGFCRSVSIDEIRTHDYVLTPGRYVGLESREDATEPLDNRIAALTERLTRHFSEGPAIERRIRTSLKALTDAN